MAMAGSVLKRLPITSGVLYLAAGVAVGPHGLGLLHIDPIHDAKVLEHVTEVAVLISLFTAGLKLRVPLRDQLWRPGVRLAALGMVVTVTLLAIYGNMVLGLSLGAAVLLGAVLAPTDPVLASDVQSRHPYDRDQLRFSLTGEAGLNDGTAFPFVMLGLGLLGLHELGSAGARWAAVDLVWATGAGLAVGSLLGALVAKVVLYLRKHHKEAVGLDDFLALGLIAFSYGAALAIHAYGFLAVFAAGLALRREERRNSPEGEADEQTEVAPGNEDKEGEAELKKEHATDPEKAPAYMANAVLQFNEALERIAEVAVVVVVGAMLGTQLLNVNNLLLAAVLFLLVRPLAVCVSLLGSGLGRTHLFMMGWFGIRGIGSLYYLMFALAFGADRLEESSRLIDLTVFVVAASIVVHGISVTPLMKRYLGDFREISAR